METVEVVIRIPKEEYEKCKREEETIRAYQRHGFDGVPKYICAILNGTILPKGHGRLCDLDAALKCVEETADCDDKFYAICLFDWAMSKRVVLEADKEVSE